MLQLLLVLVSIITMAMIPAIRFFLGGVYNTAATTWNNKIPTWAEFKKGFLKPAFVYLLMAFIIMLMLWAIFLIIFGATGVIANAPTSGILFGILFPVWFIFFILPRGIRIKKRFFAIPIWGRFAQFSLWILTPVVIITFAQLCLGVWSPEIKKEADRGIGNTKHGWANSLAKDSAQSENEAGIQGFAREDNVVVYNDKNGTVFKKLLHRGDAFRIMNLNGKPADENSIGMLEVVLPNDFGDAVDKKNGGWIASKNIIWKYDKPAAAEKKSEPAKLEPAPIVDSQAPAAEAKEEEAVDQIFNQPIAPPPAPVPNSIIHFQRNEQDAYLKSLITLREGGIITIKSLQDETHFEGRLRGNYYLGDIFLGDRKNGTFFLFKNLSSGEWTDFDEGGQKITFNIQHLN